MSKSLKNKNPIAAAVQICAGVGFSSRKGTQMKVRACPANSSATTSGGSFFCVASIAARANFMQMIEPRMVNAAMMSEVMAADAPRRQRQAKMSTGGIEPQVPGARGSRPSPKHDVSSLFIVFESYLNGGVKSKVIRMF